MATKKKDLAPKLFFINWSELSFKYCQYVCLTSGNDNLFSLSSKVRSLSNQIIGLRRSTKKINPLLAIAGFNDPRAKYYAQTAVQDTLEMIRNFNLGNESFYTVFNMETKGYEIVDPRITEFLGIDAENFSLYELTGISGNPALVHPQDLPLLFKGAVMAYAVWSLPGYEWNTNSNYVKTTFRVVPRLNQQSKKETFVIEKSSFPASDIKQSDSYIPKKHLDIWTSKELIHFKGVHSEYHCAKGKSSQITSFAYLFNAILMGLSTKHILLLHYKLSNDRNKSISLEIAKRIKQKHLVDAVLDEFQISDYFSKTIRKKVETIARIWGLISPNHTVTSDHEAALLAEQLGLVPLPEDVLDLIFEAILNIGMQDSD